MIVRHHSNKRPFWVCLACLGALLLLYVLSNMYQAGVNFPDPALEGVIREKLGRSQGAIPRTELLQIKRLEAAGRGIRDLTGLANLVNVEYLALADNKISDLTELAMLPRLSGLNLRGNHLSNTDGLVALRALQEIDIRDNLFSSAVLGDDPYQSVRGLWEQYGWARPRTLPDVMLIPPVFSHSAGFFEEAFDLHITVDDSSQVYYTLDGSMPDPYRNTQRTWEYDGPIRIEGGREAIDPVMLSHPRYPFVRWDPPTNAFPVMRVVRVIAYDPLSGKQSDVVTKSFGISDPVFREFGLPVVSLSTDPGNFFSHDTGIYCGKSLS